MKVNRDTDSFRCVATEPLDPELERAARCISEVKKRWRKGARPDTQAILAEHPHLLRYRSFVLDLAAEEFRCREAAGEAVPEDEFAERFPGMERSLFFLLEVRRMMHLDSISDSAADEICWPEVGNEFLGFSLLAELGQGTFGHVYLASEPSLGNRLVALKVAPQGHWEAEILGKLRHPNIVPVHSIQKDAETGLTAVCMPYLGQVTLLDVIEYVSSSKQRPTTGQLFSDVLTKAGGSAEMPMQRNFDHGLTRGTYIDGVVHLAIQMGDALAFTHEQGIYHRDLKPSNVLLTNEGRPLILDFNLSSEETVFPVREGGTLPYMAPEQIQCLLMDCEPSRKPDKARSDIFSLSVILYELLAGDLPFGMPRMKGDWDDIALDILARHKKGPRSLRSANPAVDIRLASLIEQCMAFDPDRRPLSAASLVDSLRRHQDAFQRVKRWSRRHPRTILGGGTTAILAGLLCAIWLATRDPYPMRLYKEGLAALHQGDSRTAVELFDQALRVAPDNFDIRWERAKAVYKEGKFSQALDEYSQLYAMNPTGELAAMRGHCLCEGRYYPEAIAHYEQAIAAGYQSASLFNNLGYCLMQRMKFQEAEDNLRKAVALNSLCPEAWHNLVRVAFKRAARGDLSQLDHRPLIDNALANNEPTAELYTDVAILETLMAHDHPDLTAVAIEHLRKAVALGADPRRIGREELFKPLHENAEFSSLLQLPPRRNVSNATDGVMMPF